MSPTFVSIVCFVCFTCITLLAFTILKAITEMRRPDDPAADSDGLLPTTPHQKFGVGVPAALIGFFLLLCVISASHRNDSTSATRSRPTSASASNDRSQGRLQQHERTRNYRVPETMLGNRSNRYEDHARDAQAWLIQDARDAVQKGQMSVSEFEAFTHTQY